MSQGPDTQRHSGSEDWRGGMRLLCPWTGDIIALGFLCCGSLLGGSSSSSFCFTALWVNGFKEPELWPFYGKPGGELVRKPGLTVEWGCGEPSRTTVGSMELPPVKRLWSQQWKSLALGICEWSDREVGLIVMCPLYLILLSLKMAFPVPT